MTRPPRSGLRWMGLAATALLAACVPASPEQAPAGQAEISDAHADAPLGGAPPYVGALAKPLGMWPQALIQGRLRWDDGCAMLGDDLLILGAGTRAVLDRRGQPVVLMDGDPKRRVSEGDGLTGGGGFYDLATADDRFGGLREPIPQRCRARAGAVLMSVSKVTPPSRFAERLYVPMQSGRVVANLAPVSGTIAVRDQCLMLDDRLLVLPIGSEAGFEDDGSVTLRIAGERYRTTVAARPGDRVEGGGRTIGEVDRPLPDLADALLDPIPARCRPAGRRTVLLAPGPRVRPGAGSDYRDPGAMGGLLPAIPPPRPVTDPADCPPGAVLEAALCRDFQGEVVEPIR